MDPVGPVQLMKERVQRTISLADGVVAFGGSFCFIGSSVLAFRLDWNDQGYSCEGFGGGVVLRSFEF